MGDQSAYINVPKEGGGGTNVGAGYQQAAQAYQQPVYAGPYGKVIGSSGLQPKQEIDLAAGYRPQTSLNKEATLAPPASAGKVDQSLYMGIPK